MSRAYRLAWIAGCALIVAVAAFQLAGALRGDVSVTELAQRDFTNLWTGGRLGAARDWATLYDRHAFTAHQAELFGSFGPRVFSYPPTAFMLMAPFAALPYGIAFFAWLAATGSFFVVAARPWWPKEAGSPWLALLMPAALLNAWLGHFGFVFGGLWLLAFAWLPRRPWAAGLLIGLFAIKPQLAVLIALVLLLRRDWRALAGATLGAVLLVLVSLLLYGIAPWTAFVTRAVGVQAGFVNAHGAGFAKLSTSAATAVFELGGPASLAFGAQALLALLGVALVVCASRRGVALDRRAPIAATSTFLVLAYGLAYDLTAVSVGAVGVMADPSARAGNRALAAVGFVAPQVGIVAAMLGLPLMSLALAALAIGQYREAIGRVAPAGAAAAPAA